MGGARGRTGLEWAPGVGLGGVGSEEGAEEGGEGAVGERAVDLQIGSGSRPIIQV